MHLGDRLGRGLEEVGRVAEGVGADGARGHGRGAIVHVGREVGGPRALRSIPRRGGRRWGGGVRGIEVGWAAETVTGRRGASSARAPQAGLDGCDASVREPAGEGRTTVFTARQYWKGRSVIAFSDCA